MLSINGFLAEHHFQSPWQKYSISEPPASKRAKYIAAYLEGIPPSTELSKWVDQQIHKKTATWDLLYIQAKITDGGTIDPNRDFMRAARAHYLKGIKASTFSLVLLVLAFISLIGLVFYGARIEQETFRSVQLWHPLGTIKSEFFYFSAAIFLSSAFVSFVYLPTNLSTLLEYGVFLGVPCLLFCYRYSPGVRSACRIFRFRGTDLLSGFQTILPWACLGFLLSSGMGLIEYWLGNLLQIGDIRDGLRVYELDSLKMHITMLIIGVVLAPICEELIYRGFIYHSMKNRFGPVVSTLVTSTFFATVHWYSLFGWISVFISGLLFTWVYERSGSLWSSVIMHALINLSITMTTHGWYSFG